MAGKKRTRTGELKPSTPTPPSTSSMTTDAIPPCAQPEPQPQPPSSTPAPPVANPSRKPPKPSPARQKLPKLPPNAKVTPRPLLHPALPTPFSSATSPKTLYIRASTPYIPSIKRIRSLLAEISRREVQSRGGRRGEKIGEGEANGRLRAGGVEGRIVDGVAREMGKSRGKERLGEVVYVKATGRAIPRALEIGGCFLGEEGVRVRVEMGSVRAVDDVDVGDVGDGEGEEVEVDVPETRLRSVSSITISIGME
ncbi:hypothetical protein P153DRAFT_421112 [Dothidotthia symphoricarpi CBS 119687]|uniref:Uncharacterized protein n=1 Tax=Dothidotthia symphoricarpi CBS 119687 TaxID=1392245 RepID=A0A6A6AJU0_9PLEO|nr:uncharacterized protein P153DRAFT_421112 [Dothidotthia symphoricarpi CBS 119687]KAF2132070.1 hypothetical protein P153DRAFT_421112 [Dothidotthia symphoricarpi CBS 119687]